MLFVRQAEAEAERRSALKGAVAESIEATGGVGAFVAATGQVGEGESGDATSILANGHVATGQVGEVVSGDATTVRRCYVGGREVVVKGGGAAREQAEEELDHEFTRPATAASDDSRRPDQSKTSIYIYRPVVKSRSHWHG